MLCSGMSLWLLVTELVLITLRGLGTVTIIRLGLIISLIQVLCIFVLSCIVYDFYPRFFDSNPESTMGIISMGGSLFLFLLYFMCRVTVRTSLTQERYKISSSLKELEQKGNCDLYRGLAMAQVLHSCLLFIL